MMRIFQKRVALAAGAGMLALCLAACEQRPTDATAGSPLRITLRGALLGGPNQALARVESARVRVTFAGSQLMDTTLAYSAAGLSLSVRLPDATGALAVNLDLLAGGQVLFRGSGSADVQRGTEARVSITVTPVASALLAPDSVLLTAIGDSVRLGAAVVFASGDTIPEATVSWAGDGGSLFRITTAGLLTALQEGQGQAQVTFQSFSRSVRVRVAAVVARVSVAPDTVRLFVDSTATLSAVARDRNGNVLQRTIGWSSSAPSVASVDAKGVVRAVAPGTATITASSGSVSASATVIVRLIPVASVTVTPAGATLLRGQTVALKATLRAANGAVLTGRPVTWKSGNPAVASVDTTGLVTALATGSALVTATCENQSASALIDVVQPLLVVSGTQVSFTASAGSSPVAQTLTISNGGGGTLKGLTASVTYGAGATGWLSATLSDSVAPATLTVTPSTSGLPVGTYSATVTVTSSVPGAGTTQVSVQLAVRPATPVIALSATSVTLHMRTDTLGAQVTYDVSVTNSGSGTLTGLSADMADNPYCSAQLSSATAPATLTITCSGFVSVAAYTGTITVSSTVQGVAPRTINVSYGA